MSCTSSVSLSRPTHSTSHQKYWICQTRYPWKSTYLIRCHWMCRYHNTFTWFKYNDQKAESWRAASLSKLGNNLIFNTELFHIPLPGLIYNHPYNTKPLIPFFTTAFFHLPTSHPHVLPKPSLQFLPTTPPKIFPSTAVLQSILTAKRAQWVREYCVHTVSIFPCLPEAWAGRTTFRITNLVSLRLRKSLYWRL